MLCEEPIRYTNPLPDEKTAPRVQATLLIFSGLPGVGKTSIARLAATTLGAAYVRIDTLEQALLRSGLVQNRDDLGPAGYMAGYALAADNLRTGLYVVADSVNPLSVTREAWRHVAVQEGAAHLEIEVICSNLHAHRQRVETRISDIVGLALPDWQSVLNRHYEPWDRDRLILDTSTLQPDEAVHAIIQRMRATSLC